jgi:osmoprotectant transport system ATP-binding protein
MITFEHVSRRYGDVVAVDDLSFEIGDGEIVILVGPSGCGKTTSLKMINRLIEPTSGSIRIDGRDTREQDANTLRRSIGYVIQQVGLFPHLTIAENVATVPRLLGWDRRRIQARVEELLDLVGLPAGEFGPRLPAELSGGQRQRIGVARALGADPPILLMDEPFGAIDPVTRERLQDELLRLQGIVRKTIVFVTHDIDEAIKLGDRIALFQGHGRLAQYATPMGLLAEPAGAFVEEFLGGDRLVRRLALIPLSAAELPPLDGAPPPQTRVPRDASLRDALDAVLRADDGRVAVLDGDTIAGVIDADAIRRAAR